MKLIGRKHGMKHTRIYREWQGIKNRCKSHSNISNLKNYINRGIVVCEEWTDKESGFINFYNWAMSNGYSDELEIDRINVDGNYEPNNCRWILRSEQYKNKQNSIYIIYGDKEWYLIDLLKHLNRFDEYDKIKNRIQRGWSVDEIFEIPFNMKKHQYYFLKYLLDEFNSKDEGYIITKKDFVEKYYSHSIKIATYMRNKYIIKAMEENHIKSNKFYFLKEKEEKDEDR